MQSRHEQCGWSFLTPCVLKRSTELSAMRTVSTLPATVYL